MGTTACCTATARHPLLPAGWMGRLHKATIEVFSAADPQGRRPPWFEIPCLETAKGSQAAQPQKNPATWSSPLAISLHRRWPGGSVRLIRHLPSRFTWRCMLRGRSRRQHANCTADLLSRLLVASDASRSLFMQLALCTGCRTSPLYRTSVGGHETCKKGPPGLVCLPILTATAVAYAAMRRWAPLAAILVAANLHFVACANGTQPAVAEPGARMPAISSATGGGAAPVLKGPLRRSLRPRPLPLPLPISLSASLALPQSGSSCYPSKPASPTGRRCRRPGAWWGGQSARPPTARPCAAGRASTATPITSPTLMSPNCEFCGTVPACLPARPLH